MLTVTGQAFEAFNKQAIDHWINQKSNVSKMLLDENDIKKLTETVGITVEQAFASLTSMITNRVEVAVTKGFTDAFAKVIVQAKKFAKDSMDVFTELTKNMVKKFGDAWIKILEFTSSSLVAIERDSARAVGNLLRIQSAMRSAAIAPLTPAGSDIRQTDVRLTIGKSELENIFQATHHPEWYEKDFKFRVLEIIAALNSLAAALASSPRANPATTGSSRAAVAGTRNGIALGENRVVGRVSGAVQ